MTLIIEKKLKCQFKVGEFRVDNEEILCEVKDLDPEIIDWSNVPDYLSTDDFFEMANMCDGKATLHTLHFMNWIKKVFGANIIDHPNRKELYAQIRRKVDRLWEGKKSEKPYFRQDRYWKSFMNLTEEYLSKKYRKNFLEHIYRGQNVITNESKSEDFNPFLRSNTTFWTSFRFRKT